MWHHIQGHSLATSHVGVHFWVSLRVATWALTNRDIDTSKCLNNNHFKTIVNKNEPTLPDDILVHGKMDYRSFFCFSFCFQLLLRGSRSGITWTYRLHLKIATCDSSEQCQNIHIFWWRLTRRYLSIRIRSRFMCSEISIFID